MQSLKTVLGKKPDGKTIKFVSQCPDLGDYKDELNRWFTINAINAAFEAGLIEANPADPDYSIDLVGNTRIFKRDDGCYGFTNKERKQRH